MRSKQTQVERQFTLKNKVHNCQLRYQTIQSNPIQSNQRTISRSFLSFSTTANNSVCRMRVLRNLARFPNSNADVPLMFGSLGRMQRMIQVNRLLSTSHPSFIQTVHFIKRTICFHISEELDYVFQRVKLICI